MIRVIAGKYKSRKLSQPSLEVTRPTTDRTKEAIFSMIQFKVPNSIFLDLFSGSGSIAIEAISRGAMKCVSVDKNNEAIKTIEENSKNLKINNLSIIKSDVITYLQMSKGLKFNLIFMDPPFDDINLLNESIKIINDNQILDNLGWLIIETSKPNNLIIPEGFVNIKNKKYGKSTIIILSNNI